MSAKLIANSYGKSRVRFSKIERSKDGSEARNVIRQMSVNVLLEGDFESVHTAGDNGLVVATDTMRNTVYVLAHRHELGTVEEFAARIAKHFVATYEHVTSCQVEISESPWERIDDGGTAHATSFIGGGSEQKTAVAHCDSGGAQVHSGIAGALILKTADSGFEGFYRDEYATMADTDDRIFATELTATWKCDPAPADWTASRKSIRDALLSTFANHESASVQHTLYAMAESALAACAELQEMEITMPNSHHLLMDLSRLGIENKNVVFHPVDEPYGLIKATVAR